MSLYLGERMKQLNSFPIIVFSLLLLAGCHKDSQIPVSPFEQYVGQYVGVESYYSWSFEGPGINEVSEGVVMNVGNKDSLIQFQSYFVHLDSLTYGEPYTEGYAANYYQLTFVNDSLYFKRVSASPGAGYTRSFSGRRID